MEAVTMKFKNVEYGKYCRALLTRKPFWMNKASSCKMNSQCETQDWYYIIEVLKISCDRICQHGKWNKYLVSRELKTQENGKFWILYESIL